MRDVDEVAAELRGFDGIGPFYAELVTVRGARSHRRAAGDRAAGRRRDRRPARPQPAHAADFAEVAQAWRPWRTWACVALRAAA